MGAVHSDSSRLRRGELRNPGLRYLFSKEGGTTGSFVKDVAIKSVRVYRRDRWRFSPRRLGAQVDGIPLDRPIFFLGTQGAGETIIGRCLRRNEAVVSVSGNSDQWTGADEAATIRNRMPRLPSTLWGSKHRSDLPHPELATDQLYACDSLLAHYRRTADDATEQDAVAYRRFLREHLSVYAHDRRRARFFDKTHANTVKIPLLAALLAESRPLFVIVTRDPYETCRWIVARKGNEFFRPHVSDRRRLELAAEHWSNAYRIAIADARRAGGATVVRFEDFLDDPRTVVRRLCEFVGLELGEAMIPQPGQRRPLATLPGDRKWYPLYRSASVPEITREERDVIGSRCAEMAEYFGYAPADRPVPAEPFARELVATRR
jgi:hypothetical protein